MEDFFPKNKKSHDKCDSVCDSDINNGSNRDSYSGSYSGGDSDYYETKDNDGFESESDTEGELSSDGIQQIVYSMKFQTKIIYLSILLYLNVQQRKGGVIIMASQFFYDADFFFRKL